MPVILRLALSSGLLAFCLTLPPVPAPAQTPQLNRCVGPNGDTIFTDRRCDDVGARARGIRPPGGSAYTPRRAACARTLQSLVYEISAAIDNRDVNRLGTVYHWVGHDDASSLKIYDRLQAIVDRPLIDIVPLRAAPPAEIPAEPTVTAEAPPPAPTTTPGDGSDATATDAPVTRPPVRRAPYALRLEQTLRNSATPSRTVLRLQRHFDCWWIAL